MWQIRTIDINVYKWDKNGYRPKTTAEIIRDEEGFKVKFTCFEKSPQAVYKVHNDPVYLDSCVEMFIKPSVNDDRYINFETNSNGAMLCEIGNGRYNRMKISPDIIKSFCIHNAVTDDCWSISYYIPKSFIENQIKGYTHGSEIYGNFYKCGEIPPYEHWGCWSIIDVPEPDFHRPEFFDKIF